jgi:DNA-binding transcriptional regulator GbsR (MarR family)
MTQGNEIKVSSFDEWLRNHSRKKLSDVTYKEVFEAGAASRQDEVSKLQTEIDELKKRINLALNKSEDFYDFGDGESAMAFCNEIINILKGKQS